MGTFQFVVKSLFFKRTQRGGGHGDGSKIRPIARWLARRMIWMSGVSFQTISLHVNNNRKKNVTNNETENEIKDYDINEINESDNEYETDEFIHEDIDLAELNL